MLLFIEKRIVSFFFLKVVEFFSRKVEKIMAIRKTIKCCFIVIKGSREFLLLKIKD